MSVQAYQDPAAQQIYSALFCDDISLYEKMEDVFPVLFAEKADVKALTELALDETAETRIRMLAARRLKEAGAALKENPVWGVVLEIPLPSGLDTLAVYADGRARYINFTGRVGILEDVPSAGLKFIFDAAKKLVPANGPWAGKRLPPPAADNVRFTFFAGGESYVLEGPGEELFYGEETKELFKNMSFLLRMIVENVRQ